MTPTDLLQAFFTLFVAVPVAAAILAFQGSPPVRQIARLTLLCAWLAHSAATLACLWHAFGRPSSGIGNQVLVLVAILPALFAVLWFGLWRAARRHELLQSLQPAERRGIEELADIERALEAATTSLKDSERKLNGWGIIGDERRRLQLDIAALRHRIEKLEEERAKRVSLEFT